jgi:hypothetical protein
MSSTLVTCISPSAAARFDGVFFFFSHSSKNFRFELAIRVPRESTGFREFCPTKMSARTSQKSSENSDHSFLHASLRCVGASLIQIAFAFAALALVHGFLPMRRETSRTPSSHVSFAWVSISCLPSSASV